jgi:hypothetical protein
VSILFLRVDKNDVGASTVLLGYLQMSTEAPRTSIGENGQIAEGPGFVRYTVSLRSASNLLTKAWARHDSSTAGLTTTLFDTSCAYELVADASQLIRLTPPPGSTFRISVYFTYRFFVLSLSIGGALSTQWLRHSQWSFYKNVSGQLFTIYFSIPCNHPRLNDS